jgi:hypothetical protein
MATAQEEAGRATFPVKIPDLYQLRGAALHITYSTTSFVGKPRFVYQDALQTPRSFQDRFGCWLNAQGQRGWW